MLCRSSLGYSITCSLFTLYYKHFPAQEAFCFIFFELHLLVRHNFLKTCVSIKAPVTLAYSSQQWVHDDQWWVQDWSGVSPWPPSGTGQDWSGPYADRYVINWWSGERKVSGVLHITHFSHLGPVPDTKSVQFHP